MKNRTLYGIAILLAFAIGVSANLAGTSGDKKARRPSGTQSSKSRQKASQSLRSREITTLTKGIESEAGVESWLRWLAYLENASAPDFPRFLENIPDNSGALDLLLDRWVEVAPEQCWAYLLNKFQKKEFGASKQDQDRDVSSLLFSKWAARDLGGAMTALDEVSDFPYLYLLQRTLAQKLAAKDTDRAIRYAAERNLFNTPETLYVKPGQLKKWICQNPTSAADLIFDIESRGSSLQSFGVKELVEEWSKLNPGGSLRYGLDAQSGLGSVFAEAVFEKWSQRDFAGASDWLAREASDAEADRLTPTLIGTWSQSDPEAALEWTQQSLEGELLESSVSRILIESAFSKTSNPGDVLAQIKDPEAYDIAARGLAAALWGSGKELDRRGGKLKIPLEEMIGWFDEVKDAGTYNEIVSQFVDEGREGELDFLRELASGERAPTLSRSSAGKLLRYVARENPEEALQLVSHFKPSLQPSLKSHLILKWMSQDSQATEEWFQNAEVDPGLVPRMALSFTQRLSTYSKDSVVSMLKGMSGFLREPVVKQLQNWQAEALAHPENQIARKDFPSFEELIQLASTGELEGS